MVNPRLNPALNGPRVCPGMTVEDDILHYMTTTRAAIRRDSALNTVSIAAVESCSDDIAAIHSAQRDATAGTALADPFSISLHRIEETDAYGFSLLSTSTELHRKRQVTITRFRFGRPSVLNEVKTEYETSDFYGMTINKCVAFETIV